MSTFLKFRDPKRMLSMTCSKYGLEAPVSRLIAETGRLSQTPVFVVGVWSGETKLGEGTGSAIRMAEFRVSVDVVLVSRCVMSRGTLRLKEAHLTHCYGSLAYRLILHHRPTAPTFHAYAGGGGCVEKIVPRATVRKTGPSLSHFGSLVPLSEAAPLSLGGAAQRQATVRTLEDR